MASIQLGIPVLVEPDIRSARFDIVTLPVSPEVAPLLLDVVQAKYPDAALR